MTERPDHAAALLAGIAQLTRHAGRPVSEAALRSLVTAGPDGQPRLDGLTAALDANGLDLIRREGAMADLARQHFPVLAALDDGELRLLASAEALASDDVSRRFAGWWLQVAARPLPDRRSGIPDRPSARAWFWKVLWGLRSYYFHVALATLVANVLSLGISLYTMNVYDRVVPNRTYDTLWVLTVGTLAALTFEFVARTLRGWLLDTAGKRADLEISSALFRRMLDMRLIQKPASSGSWVSNLRDFEAIRDVLTSATLTTLIDLPFFLLFVGVIFLIAPPLAVVPAAAIVIVSLAGLLAQAPLARHIRESMKEGSQRQGMATEAVEGLETIKVNNAAGYWQQRWEWLTERIAVTSAKSRNLSSLVVNFTSTVQQSGTVATVVMGVYLIHDGKLSMGGLIGVVILCGRAIAPLAQIAGLALRIQQARSAFSGLQAMMDKEVERDNDRTYLALPTVRGDIAFDRVEFCHDPKGAGLFKQLSLTIPAGERVAILGRTGSGKSTMLRLAAGLYSPTSGQVTLDGLDLRQIDPVDLRQAMGLLPQDSRLFLGTLRENLELARRDRGGDDARLIEALRQFGLDRLVSQHPRGLDLPLGEDGQGLSGGQKRLVSLVQALLRDPSVILLDEPTNGLDPTTERAVLQSIAQWSRLGGRQRTMLIVTHRPQVLDIVDRVIVMEAGRIVLDGPRNRVIEQLNQGIQIQQEVRA